MAQYVDLLIAPEDRKTVTRELEDWNSQQPMKRGWVFGDDAGRVTIIDVPMDAIERLEKLRIRYQTRPRDPNRPPPVSVPGI